VLTKSENKILTEAKLQASLLKVSQSLASTLDLNEVLQVVTDCAVELTKCDTTAIYMVDGENIFLGATSPPLAHGYPEEFRCAKIKNHPHIAKSIKTRQHLLIEDIHKEDFSPEERIIINEKQFNNLLYVPIVLKDQAIGILILGHTIQPVQFSSSNIELATDLSNQAALAMTNSKLYSSLKEYTLQLETNVKERKQTEEQLRLSEERFRLLLDNLPVGVYYSTVTGEFLYGNKASETIIGYKSEELIGKNFLKLNLLSTDDVVTAGKLLALNAMGKHTGPDEFTLTRKDGSKVDTEIKTQLMTINNHRVVVGIVQDITERKKNETALLESEEKFRTIIQSLNDIILIVDLEGSIKFQSPSAQKLLGFGDEEIIGKKTEEFIHQDDVEYFRKELNDVRVNTNKGIPNLFRIKQKNENYVYIEAIANNLLENKSIQGIVIFGKDVTEKIKTEDLLERQNAGLKKLNKFAIDLSINKQHEDVEKFINQKIKELTGADLSIFSEYNAQDSTLVPRHIEMKPGLLDKIVNIIGRQVKQTSAKVSNEIYIDMINNTYKVFDNLYDAILGVIPRPAASAIQSLLKAKHFIAVAYVLEGKLYGTSLLSVSSNQTKPLDQVIKNFMLLSSAFLNKKRNGEILRSSEEKFRNLFENHSAVKFIIDPETGKIVNANHAAAEFYGYTVNELENMNISQINILADDEIKIEMDKAKKSQKIYFEFKHRKADGSIADVEVYSSNIFINNKKYLHSIVHDITAKKKAERELRKHSLAVEQSPVSIIITNPDGIIEYVNPMFTKVTGYSYDEIVGQNPRILKSGEQADDFYKNMWLTITSGKIWTGVYHNKKKNGELFWESAIISPIKNEKGIITNYIAVKEDITEDVKRDKELKNYRDNLEELVEQRTKELDNANFELRRQLEKGKILEKKLEESLSKEKEINELKTRFIATVSHEFRTPLSALLSSSQMIERYSKNWSEEKLKQHYRRIESTISYLTKMLDDVLTISRAEREMLKNNPELTDLNELLNTFVDEIKSQITDKHNLFLDINCISQKIIIDRKLLRHVIVNLLTNAVKYSPNGGKVIFFAKCSEGELVISISDQGLGIPEDEVKYIFDPFYRAKNSVGIQGTGLGLNIVKIVIETMEGEITVKSQENTGTTFNVNIPINYYV